MNRPPYVYKTTPKGKQLDVIESTWHYRLHALLCRPGTGKTKIGLDTAGLLYAAGQIDAVIVVSPNGVHRQWVEAGIPVHLPDQIPWTGGFYSSTETRVRAHRQLEAQLRTKDMALRVLSLSFDGLQTKRGEKLAKTLATAHRTLLLVDESHLGAANTKSASYRALNRLSPMCTYKRIMTGTLLRQNPFAAYGQFEILQHGMLGYATLSSFKSMYAEMLPPTHGLVMNLRKKFREKTGKDIAPQIIAKGVDDRPIYRNLPHLRRLLSQHASFLTLADVQGTEPEVRLLTRFVSLTAEQRRLTDDLETFGVTMHNDGLLTVDNALATSMRLSQIAGGFCPSDDDPHATPVSPVNPKLDDLVTCLDELGDERCIIWCKFQAELLAVFAKLLALYGPDQVVMYSGMQTNTEKANAKRRFAAGEVKYFVGQIRAGGTGLDGLQTHSSYMLFYSNDYSYTNREQAIARLARTGGSLLITVIDIMAEDSVDSDVVRCMQTAQDVHEKVLHRRLKLLDTPVN